MSKITEPMLLDKTGQQFLGLMEKQNELLTAIASGYNYKPTSIADVFAVVQSGNASQVFNYGDQIILPWTDKATGKTYECPLDVVHFGDVTLADGETVPGMLVQWHYATPFGVQFNQFQAFKYCEEQLPAGTYNVIIGDTWGNNCVKGKHTSSRLRSLYQRKDSLQDYTEHRMSARANGKYIHSRAIRQQTLSKL